MSNLVLGEKYRDAVTGFAGTATSYAVHLNGCVRVILEGEVKKDSTSLEEYAFDVERLRDMKGNTVTKDGTHPLYEAPPPPAPAARSGGSRPSVPRSGTKVRRG